MRSRAGTLKCIQWLSDNGSAYRAYEMIDFAMRLGFVPCFTPVRSPQSNGMAEAFKRDYVYVHDPPDARSVLSQLPKAAPCGFMDALLSRRLVQH